MKRQDRFRHDVSRYERPNLRWRCGRAVTFIGQACMNGPTWDGRCGGTTECSPIQRAGSWRCSRREANGGPCASGPDAQGQCQRRRPPCAPRLSLSVWRARLSIIALGTAVSMIAVLFVGLDKRPHALSSVDPGPLSAAHAQFSGAAGCATCHAAHGKGAGAWWRALFAPAGTSGAGKEHSLSEACLDCHSFGGKEKMAHNRAFDRSSFVRRTDCLTCHTEHKGGEGAITKLSALQCRACHEKQVQDFARNHPPFPEGFPYEHTQGIRFDHVSHLNRHFTDARVAANVPKGGCIGCHQVTSAGRAIRPAGFETACAGCHADSISGRDLVLLRWPELEESRILPYEIEKACGVAGEALEFLREQVEKARRGGQPSPPKPAEAFSSVSVDQPTGVMVHLLDVPGDDPQAYGEPVQVLVREMIEKGTAPLLALARKSVGTLPAERLFQGLAPEVARAAACAWAANQEYVAPVKSEGSGWRADGLELRYARPRHADPVMRAWVEWAAAASPSPDAGGPARLDAMRRELLSQTDGAGMCGKCHLGVGPARREDVRWTYTLEIDRPNTRFNHRPHIDLLGPQKTCTICHALAVPLAASGPAGAAPIPTSAFKPIKREACTACHEQGKVRADCQLCHVYHNDHALKKGMMSDAK